MAARTATTNTHFKAERKKSLIKALYHEGAFSGNKAVDYLTNILRIGRATIFNYLREFKKQEHISRDN